MIAGPVWDAGEAMARNPRWTVAQIAWVFVARDQDWTTEAPYFDTLEATAVANRKSQMQNHRRAGRRRCKPFH